MARTSENVGPSFSAFDELTEQPKSWLSSLAVDCPLAKTMVLVVVPTVGWMVTALIKSGASLSVVQLIGVIMLVGMLLGTMLVVCRWERDDTNSKEERDRSTKPGDESAGAGTS